MPLASLYYILRPSPGFCRFSPLTDALATLCRGPPTATGAALPARAVCPQCLQVYAPDGPSPMTETGGPEPSPYLQFYWKSVTPARLCIIYGCFPGGKAESSSCNRHRMACKGHIYYWSYDKTSWPTAVLDNALHTASPFSPQELCTCYSSCLTFSFLDSVDGQVASHLFRSQQKCPFLRKAFLVHSSKSPSASLFQCPVFLALTALKLLPLFTGCCALLRDQPVQRLDEGQKPSLSRSVRDRSWLCPCVPVVGLRHLFGFLVHPNRVNRLLLGPRKPCRDEETLLSSGSFSSHLSPIYFSLLTIIYLAKLITQALLFSCPGHCA